MTPVPVPAGSPYGRDNLPYGVFSAPGREPRVGVRVGDSVLDLAAALGDDRFAQPSLGGLLARGRAAWAETRRRVRAVVDGDPPAYAVLPLDAVRLHLPFAVGDYVDFYCSEHHATILGRILRPGQEPLPPNWKHLPVGYHGRSGTVVVSGTDVRRPCGQRRGDDGPVFGPSTRLDLEAELGFVVGTGSPLGSRVRTGDFDDHVFGVVLLNDWSARDIQAWEYVPLGPHLGKSFATSVSAWVVPMAALAEARVPTPPQDEQLPYLAMDEPWGLDVELRVVWNGEEVSRPPYRETYWSPAQMLAHLTVAGASTRPGDLFASGTVSGPGTRERGSLIELTWDGAQPVQVAGEWRTFLEDGDEVVLTATAPGPRGSRIGFGECRGRILPALPLEP
ncbi:MAG TPA: fumarylacetoacetase [Intrasporangium sp.]|uniref:fumarylacetoacetase n=1 Tax=Intrasporangium sp. TaxID=1925024 RepID=UPI002D7A053F|nr:fumarylacetoacetase [Intrasporangium sp.]HET7399823.1 fumarylacetoacetase [Intrasporangium sp.]